MTDDHHRNRHRDGVRHPDGVDADRLRYFTQPGAETKPSTRHRRRRAPAGAGTGGFPAQTDPADSNGVPTGSAPVDHDRPEREPVRDRAKPPRRVAPARPAAGPADSAPIPPPRVHRTESMWQPDSAIRPHPTEMDWEREPPPPAPYRPGPRTVTPETSSELDLDPYDAGFHPRDRVIPTRTAGLGPRTDVGTRADSGPHDEVDPGVDAHDEGTAHLFGDPADVAIRPSTATAPGRPRAGRRPARDAATRKRRRIVLAVVVACLLVLVGSVGYVGLRASGMFISHKDYTNAAGTADVIVDLPENSTIADFGNILTRNDVVGSVSAFVEAAGNQSMSGGYYKLRTQIPAATAVSMITDGDNANRVGRVVIPEGLQLDNKKGVDDKTTPGIFQMIADNTAVTVNGQREGVSVEQLQQAAADDTPAELGVPQWAEVAVTKMDGDHRRIEGLIAPGTWEAINPSHSATQILHDLIGASATRFEQWGLMNDNGSGLTPYETLVSASVVEREVAKPDDYAKVARVILNRLAKDQRLEMDSTANYTAVVTNIDVHGDAYKADNQWNTYRVKGLPATPIGAVGERALYAVEHPAPGGWLYFVTIDRNGTTLFANTFDEHQRNRDRACANKLLTTGCS